ncbi:unnamed protein product [Orchesella dallaii]|uniref:Uncharacterized protein n=1 Tax=Orchesella dallaii TaxID=48710 RepID=A0ABP1RMP2_9HEXA
MYGLGVEITNSSLLGGSTSYEQMDDLFDRYQGNSSDIMIAQHSDLHCLDYLHLNYCYKLAFSFEASTPFEIKFGPPKCVWLTDEDEGNGRSWLKGLVTSPKCVIFVVFVHVIPSKSKLGRRKLNHCFHFKTEYGLWTVLSVQVGSNTLVEKCDVREYFYYVYAPTFEEDTPPSKPNGDAMFGTSSGDGGITLSLSSKILDEDLKRKEFTTGPIIFLYQYTSGTDTPTASEFYEPPTMSYGITESFTPIVMPTTGDYYYL